MMTKKLLRLLLTAVLLNAASGQAALVSSWNFTTAGLPSNASSQDPNVAGSPTLSVSGGSAGFVVSGGNLQGGFGNGNVSIINGTVFTFLIQVSGANFSDFTTSYDVGFQKITGLTGTWSYQVNNLGFNVVGTSQSITAGANSDSLAGIAVGTGNTLTLRYTLSGAVADPGSGNLTFDNFTINAGSITPVPEPTAWAAGIFSGIFALGLVGQSVRKRLKK